MGDDEREASEFNSILDEQRKRKRYNRHTPQQIQQMELYVNFSLLN